MLIILFSVYLFIILPLVTCEVETITVGSDSKTKRKNPYITKFHDEASLRPTKCQGKQTEKTYIFGVFHNISQKSSLTFSRNITLFSNFYYYYYYFYNYNPIYSQECQKTNPSNFRTLSNKVSPCTRCVHEFKYF